MTPQQIYDLKPEYVTNDIGFLLNDKFPEVESAMQALGIYVFDDFSNIEQYNIEIRYLRNYSIDFKRSWTLATVWYSDDGVEPYQPVMIVQSAGRYGKAHFRRIITDGVRFQKMVKKVIAMLPVPEADIDVEVSGLNEEMGDLTSFYGNKVDDDFASLRAWGLL